MNRRVLSHGIVGLLVGLLLAAGVQTGFNVLRYLVAPAWLSPVIETRLLSLTGLVASALIAAALGLALRRGLERPVGWILPAAVAVALFLDPYYLAALGWSDPARHQELVRGLGLGIIAVALARPLLVDNRDAMRLYALLTGLAVVIHALLPRFALLPVLGGDLETAAMAPIHLLVFAKGMILLIIAAALVPARPRPVVDGTA